LYIDIFILRVDLDDPTFFCDCGLFFLVLVKKVPTKLNYYT
jgi:hypothetical protein